MSAVPVRRARARHAWALPLALSLTTACGSTVQQTGTATVPGGPVDGLSGTETSTGGTSGVPGGTTGTSVVGGTGALAPGTATGGSTGGVGTGGASGTGSSSTGGGTTGGGPASIPTSGRGWDATKVYIGVITSKDTQQIYGTFGANNVDPGDTEAQAQAVAEHLNAQGGILGRQVVVRIKDIPTLGTAQDPTGTGQEVCNYFAQDNPVIAVWNVNTQVDQVPELRSCLAKKKIPLFTAAARAISDEQLARLAPYYYQTIMVSWDPLAPVLVARLKAQGWFGGWNVISGSPGDAPVKVGVLVDGTPEGAHTGKVVSQAVKAAGYGDAVVYQYAQASDGQSGSVQKFQGSGVTHVIVTDVELTAFQNAAASQQYKPRYGVTSYNAPYNNLEASGLTPPGANNGAMGVAWVPNLDVSERNDPGSTATGKTCDALMAKGKQSFSGKRLARLYASSLCDSFFLIAQGAKVGQGFDAASIGRGILSIGPSYAPANGFAAALRQRSPYVPGVVRDIAWGNACSCFTYGRGTARVYR